MGRQVPWEEIPEAGAAIPDGIYELEVDSLTEEQSTTGKLMYTGQFSVVEPQEFTGSMVWERYVCGSDDDQEAQDPLTWKKQMGARLLKTMLTKAQVPLGDDMDKTCAAATGMHFLGIIGTEVQEGRRPQNKIQAYYMVGERTVGVTGQTQAAPARPAARPAPRGAIGTPRPAQPTARPTAPPARQAPAPVRPAPAQVAVPKAQLLTCTICRQKVARNEFAEHVEQCQGATA